MGEGQGEATAWAAGHLTAQDDLLNRITGEMSAEDTAVFLGDDVDRGPDSKGCIQRFIEFRGAAKGRVVTLLGNYEQWLLRTLDAVCVHGGLDPDRGRFEEQRIEDIIWGTDGFPERYQGVEFVAYGHADKPVEDADGWPHPRNLGRTYGLDTISSGVLTALRLPEGTVFQSRRYV